MPQAAAAKKFASPTAQAHPNGADKSQSTDKPGRAISDPKEVAQLVMMRIDQVNTQKEELTIAVKALADTAKQLVSVYASQQGQIAQAGAAGGRAGEMMRKLNTMLTPLMLLKNTTRTLLLLSSLLSLQGCAATVGQEFRDIMAEIDAQCKKDHQGPYYDATIPNNTRHGDCDILSIKPADPLATEEGRFAYSIKLPEPHDKLKTEYSKLMSASVYFKALCEKDAGEWIFKTVEGVEGVFQGRNYLSFKDSDLIFQLKEVNEILDRNMEDRLVQPYHGRYNYMERPRDINEAGEPYVRFYRGPEVPGHYKIGTQKNRMPVYVPYVVNKEQANTLKSHYGFTWRQISTDEMLENGITGGETIIYDRTTNEVLAFRRLFVRYWPRPDSMHTRLVNSKGCQPGFSGAPFQFIQKVLVPINPVE